MNTPESNLLVEQLTKVLFRFARTGVDSSNELNIQNALEVALKDGGIPYEREVILSPQDRIDFLVAGRIGIELKIGGSVARLTEQLERYASHERIKELVLVTTKTRLTSVPTFINGKVVAKVVLWGSILG